VDVARAGDVFRPGMGFLRRNDFTSGSATTGYGWRLAPGSRLLRYSVQLEGNVLRRNEDRAVEAVELSPRLVVESRGSHQVTLSATMRQEDLPVGFTLPARTTVPAGSYRFDAVRLQYRAPQGNRLRPSLTLQAGEFYDGRQLSLSAGPTWSPSMHLNVSGTYNLEHVEFPNRDQGFTAHIGRIRSEIMLSPQTSAIAFVQYNSAQQAAVANLRFRYNPREGNDLYLVWNEGVAPNRFDFEPVRPLSTQRTVLLKYSHTLGLRY
jgi:hypothetical protein